MSERISFFMALAAVVGFFLGLAWEDLAKEAEASLTIQRVTICDPVRQRDCLRVQNGRMAR